MGREEDDLCWCLDLKQMDRPTQLLGVGLGVKRARNLSWGWLSEKGRGVPMSRQTENAGFLLGFFVSLTNMKVQKKFLITFSTTWPGYPRQYCTYKLHLACAWKNLFFCGIPA